MVQYLLEEEEKRIIEIISTRNENVIFGFENNISLVSEIELNAMTRQCLDRRIDDIQKLSEELSAWESRRNRNRRSVNWHFTAEDARTKLRSLYPKFDS